MRGTLPLALAALLSSCLAVNPVAKTQISPASVDDGRLKSMLQTTSAGPLRVDSVVYVPRFLPLATFLKRLSRGDLKNAKRMAPLRLTRSNVDDKALKELIARGFIPVFVSVNNAGARTVDAGALLLHLEDASMSLTPIPNAELPHEFRSLNSEAVAANTYNTTVTVISSLVVLSAAASLDLFEFALQDKVDKVGRQKSGERTFTNLRGAIDFLVDSVSANLTADRGEPSPRPASVDVDNPILNPVARTTRVDYNGLLFRPAKIAPGESAHGIVFFKARGVDWSALRLKASMPDT